MAAVKGQVRACRLADTYSHTRFHLALRTKTQPSTYHRLLLFRVNNVYDANKPEDALAGSADPEVAAEKEAPCPTLASVQSPRSDKPELYCMEETCPHLGAPLSHAEIEVDDIEDTRAVVCPWHQYDFDMRDGSSSTGLKTCTYSVEVVGTGDDAEVWVEAPHIDGGHEWEVVEFRGVSEEFADPPIPSLKDLNLGDGPIPSTVPGQPQAEMPTELPTSLLGFAHLVLATADPDLKCVLTREGVQRMRAGKLKSIRPSKSEVRRIRETVGLLDEPPRFATIVPPNQRGKLGRGGTEKSRIKMLHALANIEQYAIDLAWDIIARFAEVEIEGERLPVEYFLDWAKVAEDEAKHFSLLNKRLREMGSYFGSQTVHAGLWKSAMETADSLLSRIAIIHLVAEARGVDMNPLTLAKLKLAKDNESAAVLEVIHADEITHVTTGHRWFSWICAKQGLDPVQQFRDEVSSHFHGDLKGPFNVEDRAKAGLTPDFYTDLRGHHRTKQETYENGAGDGGGDTHMHPRLT